MAEIRAASPKIGRSRKRSERMRVDSVKSQLTKHSTLKRRQSKKRIQT